MSWPLGPYRVRSNVQGLRDHLKEDVLGGAQSLLGCSLVWGEMSARIVEVEAYRAFDDPGSHAYRGPTSRNRPMYGPPGHAYVYFNYGVHWMLNITALEVGLPAGVLIRAAAPVTGLEAMKARRGADLPRNLLSGPGKLCQAFGIDGRQNDLDLLDPNSGLHIEPGEPPSHVVSSRRVGLAAGKGDELPWRFLAGDASEWWSKRPF